MVFERFQENGFFHTNSSDHNLIDNLTWWPEVIAKFLQLNPTKIDYLSIFEYVNMHSLFNFLLFMNPK